MKQPIASRRARRNRTTRHSAVLGVETLEARELLAGDLRITEFMASNGSTLEDDGGAFSDWVEIQNLGDAPVNLLGWSLTDDEDLPGRWKFPYRTVAPGEYLVVFASDKDQSFDSHLLTRDQIALEDATFQVDLPDGLYDVRLGTGDPLRVRDDMAIYVQDQRVDTITTQIGQYISRTYRAEVGPATGSALKVRMEDLGGTTARGVIVSLMITPVADGEPLLFDFGKAGSPVEPGFTEVLQNSLYSPAVGYGWLPGAPVLQGNDLGTENPHALHTNFKLGASGEYLGLMRPDGTVAQQFNPEFPQQFQDISYGLVASSHPLLDGNTSLTYVVPQESDSALGTSWTEPDFDDAAWQVDVGVSLLDGLGYTQAGGGDFASLFETDVAADLLNVNSSIWIRQEFDISDPSLVGRLQLRAQYDDGFVAFLNGVEVARVNSLGTLTWNSRAFAERPNAQAVLQANVDITAHTGLLVQGTNVLAIQGLNFTADNVDFLLRVDLIGFDLLAPDASAVGYMEFPTPGSTNSGGRSPSVTIDTSSRLFSDPFQVEISVDVPGAVIHFTTDGSQPTTSSSVYSGPIEISETTLLQAIAVAPGLSASKTINRAYVRLDSSTSAISSDLPILAVENFAAGRPTQTDLQLNYWTLFEPDPQTGRTSLTSNPTVQTRAGMKIRGSSTSGREKASYSVETWDELNRDRNMRLLGMPSASDWVLYAAYEFDLATIRNTFIFELSNQIGRYATRTRFVELYYNMDGGEITEEDYRGLYVLMERITVGPNRVDIQPLGPSDNFEPQISGGWLLKNDREDPGDRGFATDARLRIRYVDPDEQDVTAQQAAWITDAFNQMYASLSDPDPETGYAQYIDIDSWIDHHILNVLPMNVDAFRLSGFFYKDRDGKFEMGPIWDFDRSMESADGRDDRPDVWEGPPDSTIYFTDDPRHPWWGILFDDPNFMQRWIDRWFELRLNQFSDENISAIIDAQAEQIAEAAERNVRRWAPISVSPGVVVTPGVGLYTDESGQTAAFTVALKTSPSAPVTIALRSSNPAEGTIDVDQLVFDSTNWNTPRQVKITGVNDELNDGAVNYSVILEPASGAAEYTGIDPLDVAVVNGDDEITAGIGVRVTPTAGFITSESRSSAKFTVVLTAAPSGQVVVPLESTDSSEGVLAVRELVFNQDNWNVPQEVSVQGADDFNRDGDIAYRVIVGPARGAAEYEGLDPEDVQLVNQDNDPLTPIHPRGGAAYQSGKLNGTWRGEVEHMKAWLIDRLHWIDSQFVQPPVATPSGGYVVQGQPIQFLSDDGNVYYMIDGSDPRQSDGSIHPDAIVFNPTTILLDQNSPSRYIIPTGSAGETGWQSPQFDDAAWNAGHAALGFDTNQQDALIQVPDGFNVRVAYSSIPMTGFARAEQVLQGMNLDREATVTGASRIDYVDGNAEGHFASSESFPGGGGENFAVLVTATIEVEVAGTYTFGVNSDEGAQLKLDGTLIIVDPRIEGLRDNLVSRVLTPGTHQIELLAFEQSGDAALELFYAVGSHTEFSSRFILLGSEPSFAPHIATDVQSQMHPSSGSLYARIPFTLDDVASVERLILRTRFDDGVVVYLNGTEVFRQNAPADLAYNSLATAKRDDGDALTVQKVHLTGVRHLLKSGENLLAVHGLNVAPDSPDFLVAPTLEITRTANPLVISEPTTVLARTLLDGEWGGLSRIGFELTSRGDMNRDGQVNADDIAGFALALGNPAAYEAVFGAAASAFGDLDEDGDLDYDDIDDLVQVLTGAARASAGATGHASGGSSSEPQPESAPATPNDSIATQELTPDSRRTARRAAKRGQ